jgi:multidrug efflux pump subunit AcrA (membrane-fusion protein)
MNSQKKEEQMKGTDGNKTTEKPQGRSTPEHHGERTAKRGDRIVQIALLVIIAAGILLIVQTIRPPAGPVGGPTGVGDVPSEAPSGAGRPGLTPGGGAERRQTVAADTAIAVETYTVTPQTVREYIKVNGDVTAERTVTMYPDTAGQIQERSVAVGQYVRVDQQLAVVDPSQPGQRFSNSPVLSTIAGTVTAIHIEIGDTVTQQTAIATVGDLSNLEVVTYVPERYAASIDTGLVAELSLEAFPEELFYARVTEVSPVVDSTSRTVAVSLALTERDARVKAGMFATMRLITQEETGVLAVPPQAVTQHYDDDVVFVATADGTVERRSVTIGLSSNDLIQITSGIAAGEAVVTAGITNVTDGATVRVVSTGGDA